MMGDLPPVKIVGVIPYVIGENSTFQMTDEVIKASLTMEKVIIDYVRSLGVTVSVRNREIVITDVAATTYIKGVNYDIGV
jgi:hydrogenase maturation protease